MAKPIKRVKTKSGVRYMRGGKFISKAAVKRSRAAKRRRNPPQVSSAAYRAGYAKTFRKPKRKKAVVKKRVTRKAAPKRAAPKRKKRAAPRRRATTKRTAPKRTTTRRKPVAKKRRAKKSAKRASFSRKHPRYKSGPLKGKFKPKAGAKRRKPAKRRLALLRRRGPTIVLRSYKRVGKKRRRSLSKARIRTRVGGKMRTYRVRRGRKRATLVRTRNPMTAIKNALMGGALFYGSMLGMKVANYAIKKYVTDKIEALDPTKAKDPTGTTAQLLGMLPAVAGLGIATLVLPKVLKGKAQILNAIQMGAAAVLLDAAFTNFVKPSLVKTPDSFMAKALGGFNVSVPYADYIPGRGTQPLADYLPFDNRYGAFQVEEALAADDIDFMQRGGAGGTLSRTVFSS